MPNLKIRRENIAEHFRSYNDHRQSIGPEFIVNSNLPVREMSLVNDKCLTRRTVNILHLNGQQININCNPTTTTGYQIFEAIVQSENIAENFFLGLCVLIGGDFIFVPMDLKIYKVAPQMWITGHRKSGFSENIMFTLFVRVKFFLPNLRGVR